MDKNTKRPNETVDYKLFEIEMFGSYESSSDSSSGSDPFFSYSFVGNSRSFMEYSKSKLLGVEVYKIVYTSQKWISVARA